MKKILVGAFGAFLALVCAWPVSAQNTIEGLVWFEQAVKPQALNNTNVTGTYTKAEPWNENLFLLSTGAAAAGKDTSLQILAASDTAGTGAASITTQTITANTKVLNATLTLSSVTNAQTIVINGLTFAAHTNTTTKASRQFKIDGDDTADAVALVGLINDATYGVPDVIASNSSGVVTIRAVRKPVTITGAPATITVATVAAQMWVKVRPTDLPSGKTWLAAKVATTANSAVSVTLIRRGGYYGTESPVAYP